MRVLYIGGTGEISLACVLSSLQKGHEVTVFNRGKTTAALPAQVRQVHGELRDDAIYRQLADENFDVVCQFLVFAPEAVDRDIACFDGHCGQYIFVSSASAYQKPTQGELVTEDMPLENPFWAYSRSKAECESHLVAANGFPVTVVRPSHTYRARVPSTVIPGDHLLARLQKGKPVIVHDDGESLWTLTRSSDFAEAFTGLIGEPKALHQDFHITSSEAFSWNTILKCVADALDCSIDIRPVPTTILVQHQPDLEGPLLGDKANSMQFDNSKIQQLLPEWRCNISLEAGIEMAVRHTLGQAGGLAEPDAALDQQIDRIIQQAG